MPKVHMPDKPLTEKHAVRLLMPIGEIIRTCKKRKYLVISDMIDGSTTYSCRAKDAAGPLSKFAGQNLHKERE